MQETMQKSQKPLPQHLNDFLDWLEIEKGLNSKSQENYARFLKKFLDWLKKNNLENTMPHELSPEHIWTYRAFLAREQSPATGKNLKKTTQNYYLIALRSLLTFFAERNILCLPSDKIKLSKKKDGKIVSFLDLDQLEKFFSAPDISKINGLRDRAILESFFSTGMRIAELLGLNRDQLKIEPASAELEITIIGKGSRPRNVYFSERSLYWIKKYLQVRDKKYVATDKEKALFVNFKKPLKRLSPRAVQKSFKRYAILSGIPLATTPHVMRHSFATDLLSKGVDFRILQEFLGHKSPTATQIYAHVTNQRLKDIHQKFHSKSKPE